MNEITRDQTPHPNDGRGKDSEDGSTFVTLVVHEVLKISSHKNLICQIANLFICLQINKEDLAIALKPNKKQ